MSYLSLNMIRVIKLFNDNPFIKILGILYFSNIIFGLTSSIINNTTSDLIFRGIATYLFSFSSIICLILLVNNKINNLKVLFFSFAIGSFIYSPYKSSNTNLSENISELTTSSEFELLLLPSLSSILILICLMRIGRLLKILLLITLGMLSVYFEARSIGFIYFIVVILFFLKPFLRKIKSFNYFIVWILFGCILLFLFLSFLISNNYLDNNSSAQSLSQIQEISRFNPFLYLSRPDIIVGVLAVLDKPILGHGFIPLDYSYVDLAKQYDLLPETIFFATQSIPNHSVLLNSFLEGGILSIALWMFLFFKLLKLIYFEIKRENNLFSISILISVLFVFWNILFSPIGYIRTQFPFDLMVIIFYLYTFRKKIHGS
jgi:hypothetical protein